MVLEDLQVQAEMPLALADVGDNVTFMSPADRMKPVTLITPEVALMAIPVALVVDWNPLAQLSKLFQPLAETNSVTQVRAPEAAKITSEDLARFV